MASRLTHSQTETTAPTLSFSVVSTYSHDHIHRTLQHFEPQITINCNYFYMYVSISPSISNSRWLKSCNFSCVVLQLDDWVLCRIYNKKGVIERYDTVPAGDVKPAAAAKNPRPGHHAGGAAMKLELSDYGYYPPSPPPTSATEMLCFDRSGSADRDSMPRLHTDSSSSDHVLSPSPDFPSDGDRDLDYAESQPTGGGWPGGDWGVDDGFVIDSPLFEPPSPGVFARDGALFGDMFTYLQKPF